MESKAKILGHPIHPMLITIPVGLFVFSLIADIAFWITREPVFAGVSYYNIIGGIAGGALAAIFGWIDFFAIPAETRAKRIATFHGFGNLMVVLLFSVSFAFRITAPNHEPTPLAMAFSVAGLLLATLTAWLGGELVDRLGVGVDPGANLNAPNSLSGEAPQTPRMTSVPVTGDHPERDEP